MTISEDRVIGFDSCSHAINLSFSVSVIVIDAMEALIAVLKWFLLQVKHCIFVTFGLMSVS